jgi:hypothetical protein
MQIQYTDRAVSRKKFDREIAEYNALGKEYRRRGWFLVSAEFPKVLVILASSKTKPPALVMGVSFDYSNYDAEPPSVRLVDPLVGEPYKFKDLPNPLNRALPQQEILGAALPPGAPRMMIQALQPYMQAHGPDEIPFLCIAGCREYHAHPAHNGDLWELHRTSGAGRLVRLLEIIYRYGQPPS